MQRLISKLLDVFPPDATDYELDQSLTDIISSCQPSNRTTGIMEFSNHSHFIVTQLYSFVITTPHVLHVLSVGAYVKMSRIAASPIIAMMAAFQAVVDWTKREFPCQTMSHACSWVNAFCFLPRRSSIETTVSFLVKLAHPRPTFRIVSPVYFIPKPYFQRSSLGVHCGYGILTQTAG